MTTPSYYAQHGGLPSQTQLLTDRAVFKEAYAFIPRGVMRDIVTSYLPFWDKTRAWIIARPLSGFAETFSQYLMEVAPSGGSETPEPDPNAEAVLFVVEGTFILTLLGKTHEMRPGSYAFIPPSAQWSLKNTSIEPARFHWIRKAYEAVPGIDLPTAFVVNEQEILPISMPDTNGVWATTRFVDREGKAVYRLNQDWVEVEAGDFMWLRAFCPQACYAGGPGRFRYLLYKDVNRQMKLSIR